MSHAQRMANTVFCSMFSFQESIKHSLQKQSIILWSLPRVVQWVGSGSDLAATCLLSQCDVLRVCGLSRSAILSASIIPLLFLVYLCCPPTPPAHTSTHAVVCQSPPCDPTPLFFILLHLHHAKCVYVHEWQLYYLLNLFFSIFQNFWLTHIAAFLLCSYNIYLFASSSICFFRLHIIISSLNLQTL